MAKRRMLILVNVAPAEEPLEEDQQEGEGSAVSGAKKSEVKTGFFGVAGAGTPTVKPSKAKPGSMIPLGTCREVVEKLKGWNIYPDGSGVLGWGETPGMATLYGPGCIMELPTGDDGELELSQAMISITDEDFAWPVLSKMCRRTGWKMMDPESGRMFG